MEIEVKNNLSRTYIIPLMADYLNFNRSMFINSYLFDVNKPEFNVEEIEGLFLLIKWMNLEEHKIFEKGLFSNPLVKDHYDVNKDYYMIYSKFPSELEDEIKLLIDGKYSKVNNVTKGKIINYWKGLKNDHISDVLLKSPALKKRMEMALNVRITDDAELGNKMNFHKETFSYLIEQDKLQSGGLIIN